MPASSGALLLAHLLRRIEALEAEKREAALRREIDQLKAAAALEKAETKAAIEKAEICLPLAATRTCCFRSQPTSALRTRTSP